MKLELDMPEIKGFEYTGEFRQPKWNEYFQFKGQVQKVYSIGEDGRTFTAKSDSPGSLVFSEGEYAILKKIEPVSMKSRIELEYLKHDVVMLFWHDGHLSFHDENDCPTFHIAAVSMMHFNGYVFHIDETFYRKGEPIIFVGTKIEHPLAFLLRRK